MFLTLTSLESFWEKKEKILFLGEWCKIYNRKEVIDKIDHEVLPYHWDDREKLYKDYLYIDDLYERMLSSLCNYLNHLHGVGYSTRYWRIILGFWLNWLISIVFDRFESIRVAGHSGKVTNTYILDSIPGEWTPNDYTTFANLAERSDYYNLYLYSQILKSEKTLLFDIKASLKHDTISEEIPHQLVNSGLLQTHLKSIGKKTLAVWDEIIGKRFSHTIISSSAIGLIQKSKLQLALLQVPFFGYYEPVLPNFSYNHKKRNQVKNDFCPENKFENFLADFIIGQIPKCYIEGYNYATKKSLEIYPTNPKVIFSDNSFYHKEYFKFWAAEKIEQGTLFVTGQHGGLYGTAKWFACEDHEIAISDFYFSWGWRSENNKKIIPMPSFKLNNCKNISPVVDGKILMVTSLSGRYSYHLYSEPIAALGYISHLKDHFSFIDNLAGDSRSELIVRMYPFDRGKWFQKDRFDDLFPDVQIYLGHKSLHTQLAESKLFIGTYNATTYLETFVANFPTILFWNPKQWELNTSAQHYFNELRRVGILHDTPESAATLVNEISSNPIRWWNQSEIQSAKDKFCARFAITSEKILEEWQQELKRIQKMSQ